MGPFEIASHCMWGRNRIKLSQPPHRLVVRLADSVVLDTLLVFTILILILYEILHEVISYLFLMILPDCWDTNTLGPSVINRATF